MPVELNLSLLRDRLNTLALSYYIFLVNAFMLFVFMQQMFLHNNIDVIKKNQDAQKAYLSIYKSVIAER